MNTMFAVIPEEAATTASSIAASLMAGTKLPVDQLAWFIGYVSAEYFPDGRRAWRNKKHQTVYHVAGVELRVTDGNGLNDRGSPLVVSVAYHPITEDGGKVQVVNGVVFNRALSDFLVKFEPVTVVPTWVQQDIVSMPALNLGGIVA